MYKKVYLKITTVPQTENISPDSQEFRIYKEKYLESREFTKDSEIIYSYYNDASKTPSFAKIHSITLGKLEDDKAVIKVLKGEERDLLNCLLAILNSEHYKKAEVVCFNRAFNFTFITTRLLANRISTNNLPLALKVLNAKPWEIKGSKGLSEHYNGIGWWKMNFDELCFVAGIPTDMIIDGSDVYSYIKNAEQDKVDNSDISYIFSLINLDRISEDLTEITDLDRAVEELKEIEEVVDERNPLEKLYTENQLTEAIKKELETVLKKKKPTKKEKLHLINMIHTLSCNTEMFKSDKPDVVKEKLIEAEEFINKL